MNSATTGMLVGMALAFAGWFAGFGAFLLVAALGAAGWTTGGWVDRGGRLGVRLRVPLEPGTPPEEVVAPLAASLTETDASVGPYTLRTRVRLGARAFGATRVGRTGVARPRTAGTADVS